MYPRHVTLLTVLTLAVDRTRVTCELSNEVALDRVENRTCQTLLRALNSVRSLFSEISQ